MELEFGWLAAATVAYGSTNVDGYALLLGFFSNARYRTMEIVAGQVVSLLVQLAVSAAIVALGIVREAPFVGLLGIVPLVVGIRRIGEVSRRGAAGDDGGLPRPARLRDSTGRIAVVAAIATSGAVDNVLVYASLLAGRTRFEDALTGLWFVILTVSMCLAACATARSNAATLAIQRATRRVSPYVTAAIGAALIVRFDTVPWIYSLA